MSLHNIIRKLPRMPRTFTVRQKSSIENIVEVSVDSEGIATLSLNNKPVNALTVDLLTTLNSTLDDLNKEKFKGVILTSSLPTVFCAGLDLKVAANPDRTSVTAMLTGLQDAWVKLFGSHYVTAAAINGHAPAGGCLLSLSCEYRTMVSTSNYTIGMNETPMGMVASDYFVETMVYTIGKKQAERALTAGTLFTADQALEIGLIDTLAANKDDCIQKCKEFIKKFDKVSPEARGLTNQSLRRGIIDKILKTRDVHLSRYVDDVFDEKLQASLKVYLQELKQKKIPKN